jgi:hypothetical protein
VQGPLVKGLHGRLPTQRAAAACAFARDAARVGWQTAEGGGEDAAGGVGCGHERAAGGAAASAAAGVDHEAAVLRDLVYYFLRAGGDLVGECVRAGGPIPTPAVCP